MVCYCPDCRFIFATDILTCPACRSTTRQSSGSEQAFLDNRYKRYSVSAGSMASTSGTGSTKAVHIDDDDILESLRKTYTLEHETNKEDPQTAPSTPTAPPEPKASTTSTPASGGGSIFEQVGNQTPEFPNTQPSFESSYNPPPEPRYTTPRTNPVPRRFGNALFRGTTSVFDFLSGIRLGLVIRILFIILAVSLAVAIWNMRHAILDAIFAFVLSLLPLAVCIYLIYSIFRSFFR